MDTTVKLLEEISQKLNGSAVLNGGFDRLVTNVELIKQKQNENAEELKKIHAVLYDPHPEVGLFSKVRDIENGLTELRKSHDIHVKTLENIKTATQPNENKVAEEVKAELTQKLLTDRLKRVAGEDLEKLESTVNVAAKIKTLHWQLIVATLAMVVKTIYDFVTKHS